ncbi:tRNA (adenosine(37)-N6)-threonylcarbamoyltransferase complex ATPase subunit type 1 TsaE [Candidatus Parcubacteria bacterium]|nr:tRNA (adenosine(37)-N6)-threonylcarbamoyltransferase complex ATPase subunit type 1 TsaE [Candidatus Parcubacteria bacterium]
MFELAGEVATRAAGEILGELLGQESIGKHAFVLALEGELGAGKTTFVRGLAKGLGIREKVTSPSFLIAKPYPQDDAGGKMLWHFDFYRLEHPTKRDLELLNFSEILRDPKNIVAVEWAERVRRHLPRRRFALEFSAVGRTARRLLVAQCF